MAKVNKVLFTHPDKCINCKTCEDACAEAHDGISNIEVVAFPEKGRFGGENHKYETVLTDPFIVRDNNKCVMCGKCVRICQEVEGRGVLTLSNRGFGTKVEPAFNQPLKESGCSFCGHCVSVCPVGALVENDTYTKDRTWRDFLLKKTETTCAYCGCGCVMEINSKDGVIAKITSSVGKGSNNGSLCVKGRFGYEFVNSPDRLKKPLIRTSSKKAAPKFRQASWGEVLKLIAKKFSAAKKKDPDSFAALSSARCTNEENYIFQKFARMGMGTNNVDHCARLCHASTVTGLMMAFGSGAMTNSIADLENAEIIFVIGSNTTESHPIIGLRIKKAVRERGAKVILCDPRKIELADYASVWMRQKPGTDVALLNGLMNVIVRQHHQKQRSFIKDRTENYEEFYNSIKDFTPEMASEITGVPAEAIRNAGTMLARSNASCFVYSMGITQHTTGVDNVLSVANIAMLTGNIGRTGTGVYPLRGQNNVQGACDMGALPNVYPGYQNVADAAAREKFEKAWGTKLPEAPGLTVTEIMDAVSHGTINTLYIMGENPVLSDPDSTHVKKSLKKVDFLVVQDIFLTETAQLADVVLPAFSWAEKDGTFTNTERRVQLVRSAIPGPGEAKADSEIVQLIAETMGLAGFKFNTARNIFREMATLTPQYAGMGHGRLEETGGLCWPCPTPDHPGTPILHTEKFTRGLGKFHAVSFRPPAENPDKEYPFLLTTGRILQHYHTGTMTRRVGGLNHIVPEAFVEINPKDATKLKVGEGDFLKVASRRGEIKIKARVTERVTKGVVFIPFHFAEASANVLTSANVDPLAKIPEYKVSAVKIAKA
jgi:formate dehydrogenase alpha subunit